MKQFAPASPYIVVPASVVRKGPPAPYGRWDAFACLAFIRGLGIQADEFLTWCRHKRPDGTVSGYRLYYRGETPTVGALAKLH